MCKECKQFTNKGFKFCPYCGQELPQEKREGIRLYDEPMFIAHVNAQVSLDDDNKIKMESYSQIDIEETIDYILRKSKEDMEYLEKCITTYKILRSLFGEDTFTQADYDSRCSESCFHPFNKLRYAGIVGIAGKERYKMEDVFPGEEIPDPVIVTRNHYKLHPYGKTIFQNVILRAVKDTKNSIKRLQQEISIADEDLAESKQLIAHIEKTGRLQTLQNKTHSSITHCQNIIDGNKYQISALERFLDHIQDMQELLTD